MREDTNLREALQARGRAFSKGGGDVIGLELLIMDIHSGHYAHVTRHLIRHVLRMRTSRRVFQHLDGVERSAITIM